MSKSNENISLPDRRLAAVCGLFCPACSVFIGTKEEPERLKGIAARTQQRLEEVQCNGCRTEKRCYYCAGCKKTGCAAEKGVEFCGECPDYPCQELKVFQAEMPHRIELWQYQERIKEVGYEKWYKEMLEHYSCPNCNTLNSAYDIACRKCGTTPSCAYVGLHKDIILEQLTKKK